MKRPYKIDLGKTGDSEIGFLSVAQKDKIPFEIKRVYWTYDCGNVTRGHHAHRDLEQVIFAINGVLEFTLDDGLGYKKTFILDSPNEGVFVPKGYWRTIVFKDNSVLLCLASVEYEELDYIRDYKGFVAYKNEINKG